MLHDTELSGTTGVIPVRTYRVRGEHDVHGLEILDGGAAIAAVVDLQHIGMEIKIKNTQIMEGLR